MPKKPPERPKLQWLAPESLIPYTNNAKVHTSEQIAELANLISKFGFDQPIVVDPKMVIGKGHCRREAAISLGMKEVPVIVAEHLSDDEFAAMRIADNKIAESSWDTDKLRFDLGTLTRSNPDLVRYTGFKAAEIEKFINTGEIAPEMFGGGAASEDLIRSALPPAPVASPPPPETVETGQDLYTKKIESPIYKPTLEEAPAVWALSDDDKYQALLAEIEGSDVTEEEKEFLRLAAQRHVVFDYENIAEFYAHASPGMQRLMENSALVIVDFQRAIENGFVVLAEKMADAYKKNAEPG